MTTTNAEAVLATDPLLAQASALAGHAGELARELGREDLQEGLSKAQATRAKVPAIVVVCGERDAAKSALTNALLGRPGLLKIADETSLRTYVTVRACRGGEAEQMLVHRLQGEPLTVPLDELSDWATELRGDDNSTSRLEVVVDSGTLAGGLMLVITPGVGGLARARGQRALSALSGADAALLVIDAGTPISAPELEFSSEAAERVENVVIVVDRNDRQHGVHEVQSESEAHLLRLESARDQTSLLATSSRMKSRADRMRAESGPQDELAAELERESGIPDLSALLGRLAAERDGSLHAARLCRLAGSAIEVLRARENELLASANKSTEQLHERLEQRTDAKKALAREVPALRRELHNELRLLQREADASMATRLNGVRRDFDHRLAEGDSDDFEGDLEALLLKALGESLDDVRSGLEVAASNLKQGLTKHGVEMQLDIGQLEAVAQPTVAIVEAAPSTSGTGDWIGRAPFALAATVFNPLYAVAGVVGIIFDRHRVKRRAQREQLSRQVTETVNETRAQLSVAVHHTVVNGQSVLTEAFEDAAEQRREEIEEEIGALQAQTSMSESKRAQGAKDAQARLSRLNDLFKRIEETRRAALGVLTRGSRL